MTLLTHNPAFITGTRVLLLKGRHKDGEHEQRCIMRVTHDSDAFTRALGDLYVIRRDHERIYATANRRSVKRAARIFKQRQIDAQYDQDEEMFYRAIDARWASCLMQMTVRDDKFWMFDSDSEGESAEIEAAVREHSIFVQYRYKTKNGEHFIVGPFNREKIGTLNTKLNLDPLMLWAY